MKKHPPATQRRIDSALTTHVGGVGVAVGGLYPVFLALPDMLPITRDASFADIPSLSVLSGMILAISFAILAFGLTGETGIVGRPATGQWALFVFGILLLILRLSTYLTVSSTPSNVEGYVSLLIALIATSACAVAAVAVVRARVLFGIARWSLVAVTLLMLARLVLESIPIQSVSVWAMPANAFEWVAVVGSGLSFAVNRRVRSDQ